MQLSIYQCFFFTELLHYSCLIPKKINTYSNRFYRFTQARCCQDTLQIFPIKKWMPCFSIFGTALRMYTYTFWPLRVVILKSGRDHSIKFRRHRLRPTTVVYTRPVIAKQPPILFLLSLLLSETVRRLLWDSTCE